jgi:hypothetical protein
MPRAVASNRSSSMASVEAGSRLAVALALGEIDPHYEGKQVIIAYPGGERRFN